jgi:hypothetical protein
VEGEVELTPIQRRYLEEEVEEPWRFTQSRVWELASELTLEQVEAALGAVVRQHDALRLRVWREGGEWRAWNRGEMAVSVGEESEEPGLDGDRLWGAALAGAGSRLRLVVHHLVVDVVSWGVLEEDVERALEQVGKGESVDLGRKTTSYREWGRRLREEVESGSLEAERGYWEEMVSRASGCGRLELSGGESGGLEEVWLGEEETGWLLEGLTGAYRMEAVEVVLTGLLQGLRGWQGRDVAVEVERHGREELSGVDVSRTVGWFTSVHPLQVEVGDEAGEGLKRVKEAVRGVPRRGLGYGLLRYLGRSEGLRYDGEVSFNFLGVADAVGRGKPRPYGGASRYRVEVLGFVYGGRLGLAVRGPAELGRALREAFGRLVEYAREPVAGAHTPSDFPLAVLDDAELAEVAALVEGGRG